MKSILLAAWFCLIYLNLFSQSPSSISSFEGIGKESISALAIGPQGKTYITGSFQTNMDFDPSSVIDLRSALGSNDAFLIKLDSSGALEWGKHLSGPANEYGNDIVVDALGNAYVCGIFEGTVDFIDGVQNSTLTSRGEFDIFLCKYSPSGNLLWSKQIGGSQKELGPFLNLGQDGLLYLAASFEATVQFNPSIGPDSLSSTGQQDLFILKMDTSGSALWVRHQEGINYQYAGGIAADINGNVYFTGSYVDAVDFNAASSPASVQNAVMGTDAFLSKYDSNGHLIWVNSLGSFGFDLGIDVDVIDTNQIICGGNFDASVDFNPKGTPTIMSSNGSRDIFLARYDGLGNLIWSEHYGGSGADALTQISLGTNGSIAVSGNFLNSVNFNPNGNQTLNSNGNADGFALSLDASGSFLAVDQVGGPKADALNDVAFDPLGLLRYGGSIIDSASFTSRGSNFSLVCNSNEDAYLLTQLPGSVGLNRNQPQVEEFQIYPNPSIDQFQVEFSSSDWRRIQLFEASGRLVFEKTSSDQSVQFDLDLSPGLYIVLVNESGRTRSQKLIQR